jgi:polysaccharide export outer membrane protein
MSWLRLLLLVAVIPLAGCATVPRSATYPVTVKGPYQLDTGDVVRVTVYGDETLSTTYKVDDNGAISVPLIGPVRVRGTTTEAASARLAGALANGFMRNPQVAMEMSEYRPFFIQGAVNTAGQFPYVYGMTVRAAISTAGGFSATADRSRAVLYRPVGREMSKGVVELDFPIYPGDTIVIGERWF